MNWLIGTLKSFFRYFISASGGILTDWLVFEVIFLTSHHHIIAQGISRIAGGVVAFYLHRSYSFKVVDGHLNNQAKRFLVAFAGGWLVSIILITIFSMLIPAIHGIAGQQIAKFFSDGICFMLNYFVMRFYVFHHKPMNASIAVEMTP